MFKFSNCQFTKDKSRVKYQFVKQILKIQSNTFFSCNRIQKQNTLLNAYVKKVGDVFCSAINYMTTNIL